MKIFYNPVILTMLLLSVLGACVPRETAVAPPEPVVRRVEVTKGGREGEWEKLVTAAKKEGKVGIYENWGPQTRIQLTNAFKERFGIDLEFTSFGKPAEMTPRLVRERQAGLYLADVIGGSGNSMVLEMKPAGILAPLEPVLVLPEVIDAKYWTGGRLFADKAKSVKPLSADFSRSVARNTDLVREGEIKSYLDLLDPKWKGKIELSDPAVGGAGTTWVTVMVNVWGLDKTKDYLRQFVRQEPAILRDNRLMAEGLARGKYAINAGTHPPSLREFQKMGAPVAIAPVKEGGHMTSGAGNVALPAGQLLHPNAARVFINWILTKEGGTIFSKAYSRPSARTDVSTEGFEESIPMPGEPVTVLDEDQMLTLQSQLSEIQKEIFLPFMR